MHTMPVAPARPAPVRFSANLSFRFKDAPFVERFARARQEVFRRNVPVALELAREDAAWAAEQARGQGASIMIEAVNSYENGPYLLDTTAKAVSFLDAVGEYNPSTATTEESLGWIKELGYA
jgi:hydroxypyruvate isomerase